MEKVRKSVKIYKLSIIHQYFILFNRKNERKLVKTLKKELGSLRLAGADHP